MSTFVSSLILAHFSAQGQIPAMISYQGTIADQQGQPMNGTFDMRFRILDVSSTEQWSSGIISVAVLNGAYAVNLGEPPQPALPPNLFAIHDILYLEISFDDGTHGMESLSPTVQMLPVPYALRAAQVDNMNGSRIELRDATGDLRFVIDADSGLFQMLKNDTAWFTRQVNSPDFETHKLPDGGTLSIVRLGNYEQRTYYDANQNIIKQVRQRIANVDEPGAVLVQNTDFSATLQEKYKYTVLNPPPGTTPREVEQWFDDNGNPIHNRITDGEKIVDQWYDAAGTMTHMEVQHKTGKKENTDPQSGKTLSHTPDPANQTITTEGTTTSKEEDYSGVTITDTYRSGSNEVTVTVDPPANSWSTGASGTFGGGIYIPEVWMVDPVFTDRQAKLDMNNGKFTVGVTVPPFSSELFIDPTQNLFRFDGSATFESGVTLYDELVPTDEFSLWYSNNTGSLRVGQEVVVDFLSGETRLYDPLDPNQFLDMRWANGLSHIGIGAGTTIAPVLTFTPFDALTPGYEPVAGDWDGDGSTDFKFWHSPSDAYMEVSDPAVWGRFGVDQGLGEITVGQFSTGDELSLRFEPALGRIWLEDGTPNRGVIMLDPLTDDVTLTAEGVTNAPTVRIAPSTNEVIIEGDQLRVQALAIDDVKIVPDGSTTQWTMTLPPNPGTPGYALKTNGAGVLSWDAVGTGDFLRNGSLPMTGNLNLGGNSITGASACTVEEIYLSSINSTTIKTSPLQPAPWIWTVPMNPGTNGQALLTDGTGNSFWGSPSVSGAAGGDLSGTYPNPVIATGAVTSNKIQDATVAAADLGAGSVVGGTGGIIQDNSITTADIGTGGVGSDEVCDDCLTAADLAASSVSSSEICDDCVAGTDIAADAISASELASSGVSAGSYGSSTQSAVVIIDADGRVTSASSVAIAVSPSGAAGGDLTGNYPNPTIAGNAVTTSKIQDGTITSSDLGNSSVTGGTGGIIQDNSVTAADIATGAVSSDEVCDDCITATDLATGSVNSAEVCDDCLSAADIASDAITASELSGSGVSAGSYGSTTQVPVLTIDVDGRVTSATTTTVSGDNLGNHTAAMALNMNSQSITNAGNITTNGTLSIQSPGALTIASGGTLSCSGSGTFTSTLEVQSTLTLNQAGSGTILRTSQMTGGNHVETTTNTGNSVTTTTNPVTRSVSTSGLTSESFTSTGMMILNQTHNDGSRQTIFNVTDQASGMSNQLVFNPNGSFKLLSQGSVQVVGNLDVAGNLTKLSGTFKIDHPLDPYNKYLYHSFVESPDMMNIYNGNIVTNDSGVAVVVMPDYFEALNRDFRYQLTVIGEFAQAIVASEMEGNHFTIKTDKPNVKVSWQVTGVRQDTFAEENRIVVEVDKEDDMKGTLLYAPKQTEVLDVKR